MSRNKKWSVLLRVVLVLVLVCVGVAGGYYLWGRSPVPQAFFERPGSGEAFPVRDEIFSLISDAQHEVLAVQMEAGDIELLEALASVSADASVRIITTPNNAAQFSKFTEPGLEIEYLETGGVLHHKFVVVDGKRVLTGSYNWSQNAYERNWENAVLVTNRTVAESFQLEFEYLWGLAKPPAASEPDGDKKSCLERLNAARFADLVAVKGIADIRALRILEYRESHGGFATPEELIEVYDIGPALRSAILEELGCSTP
jgi:DNA uptake protein ComE-like DNA-binding protein